jgi:hypothetical protein
VMGSFMVEEKGWLGIVGSIPLLSSMRNSARDVRALANSALY